MVSEGNVPIKYCKVCDGQMGLTIKEDRNPKKQWECPLGHTQPVYGVKEEGEA